MDNPAKDWLVGGGQMGHMIRARDWSRTPLGPIDEWPQSLRTTVGLCLSSNFPINLIWGSEHIQIFNDGYLPLCGDKFQQVLGESFRESWASAWSVLGAVFDRALQGETSFLENQRLFLDRNGYLEETFFTFSLSPVRDETGRIAGLFNPATETTARMVAERRSKALRELSNNLASAQTTDEVYRTAIETISDCECDIVFAVVYEFDQEGTKADLTGSIGFQAQADMIPESVLLADDDCIWPLKHLVCSAKSIVIDQPIPWPCGPYPEAPQKAVVIPLIRPRSEQATGAVILGASPRLPFDNFYKDFLEFVAATMSTALSNARAYEEEKRKAEELAALDKAKTTFFSNISHEFRTPLTLMLVPLEELLSRSLTEISLAETRERLELVHRNSLRLLKLVNNLLDFSRLEAGRFEATFRPTPLEQVTRELCSSFHSAAEVSGIKIFMEWEGPFEPVYVDREMWDRIILNLLSNAFKYTLSGFIKIKMIQEHGKVQVSVQDSGIGISQEDLPRLFDRFYRVHESQGRSYEGTGIGLAMVKELLKLHGGQITLASELGVGSTFTVTLPLGKAHLPAAHVEDAASRNVDHKSVPLFVAEAKSMVTSKIRKDQRTASGSSRSRILLIDDNSDMRETIQRLLDDQYEVITACDGLDGYEEAQKVRPDLILCDIMMPRLNGFGLVKKIRDDEKLRTTPCILISARAGEEARVEGLDQGADDYLTKPFSTQELIARIAAHLKMAKVRDEAARRERQLLAEVEGARRSNEIKDEFLATISHELRTPMNAILGFSHLLREEEPGSVFFDNAVDAVIRNAEQQNRIISDLLDISRIITGKMKFEVKDLYIEDTISAAIESLSLSAKARDIKVVWIPSRQPHRIIGDPGRLQQMMWNILSNAIRFSKANDVINIILKQEGEAIRITVKDQGEGISPEFLPFACDPLRQEDGSHTRPHGGLGLGLKIVQEIIEGHGGRVSIASPGKGRGTSVSVLLPIQFGQAGNIMHLSKVSGLPHEFQQL